MTLMLLLAACDPAIESVHMYGYVYDAPALEGDVLAGAALTSLTDDGTTVVEDTTSYDDGTFAVEVPAGATFFLHVAMDGYVPTGFSAVAPLQDFYAGDGVPFVLQAAYMDEVETTFADCPDVGTGAAALGEVRLYVDYVDDLQSLPVVSYSSVSVTGSDGAAVAACYVDDSGLYDPNATEVGETGRFAAFGLPAGPTLVEVTVHAGTGDYTEVYEFSVPDGGVIPMLPALVHDPY